MENAYLRASLGMTDGLSGVMVNRVQPTSPTARALKKGDVLLAFDDTPIANDGTVPFRARERIFFTSLITQKPTASTARIRVLREKKVVEFDVPLQPLQTLVPICKCVLESGGWLGCIGWVAYRLEMLVSLQLLLPVVSHPHAAAPLLPVPPPPSTRHSLAPSRGHSVHLHLSIPPPKVRRGAVVPDVRGAGVCPAHGEGRPWLRGSKKGFGLCSGSLSHNLPSSMYDPPPSPHHASQSNTIPPHHRRSPAPANLPV
jgi:hypothetical protein